MSPPTPPGPARGHEILLQAPIEPFDSPQNDPGPHTLRVEAGDTKEDLHWLMSRFSGYVGLMSFLGSRFTSDEQALAPALEEIARRGLFIVDDGGSPQSLIPATATKLSLPATRVDIVLDQRGTPQSLEAALAALETQARRTGSAIGFANAQGPTIARLARFAREARLLAALSQLARATYVLVRADRSAGLDQQPAYITTRTVPVGAPYLVACRRAE